MRDNSLEITVTPGASEIGKTFAIAIQLVDDSNNEGDTCTFDLTVPNTPPVLDYCPPRVVKVGEMATFTFSGSD